MKRLIIVFAVVMTVLAAKAQGVTENFTVYKNFKPAVIHMASGKNINNALTNIFLKNASLLYMKGSYAMEANMESILGVDFDDHQFIKIDNMLACLLDTVGPNRLYCATVIDVEAYNQMLRNNINITNFSLFGSSMSDQMSYATVELTPEDEQQMPLINHFYYLYNGEIIKVHERELSRILPKSKKRIYKTIISMDGFRWVDRESLVKLLKAISADDEQQ